MQGSATVPPLRPSDEDGGPEAIGRFQDALDRAVSGLSMTEADVADLISVTDRKSVERLFEAARAARDREFGRSVFCYGFVYFSTYCRNDCSFCFYRRSNRDSVRYRKTDEEVISIATDLADDGVHLVDLTMGEDVSIRGNDRELGYERLVDVIRKVDEAVDVPIMVSPGALPRRAFPDLAGAGADWYACYQETYDRQLFAELRRGQDFEVRSSQKAWAMEAGMLAEDGMLIGTGEGAMHRAASILAMGRSGARQIRAMTFIPQACHTDAGRPVVYDDELKAIAAMRLLYPDRLIPASLDVEGLAGLRTRMDAGANVITSIIPPRKGLAGVAQHELDVDSGGRTVAQTLEVLDDMGLRMAQASTYKSLVESWKRAPRGGAP